MIRPPVSLRLTLLVGVFAFAGLGGLGGLDGLDVAQASQAPPAAEEPPPDEPPTVLGAPSAFDQGATAERRMKVAAGTRVRERPDPESGALAIVDAATELPVVERRGDWAQVRYGGFKGWVWAGEGPPPAEAAESASDESSEAAAAPSTASGAAAAPPTAADGSGRTAPAEEGAGDFRPPAPGARSYAPDPQAVRRARVLLGDGARELDAGPWRLLTDVGDERLLASLDRLATELPAAYEDLYGLTVELGGPAGASAAAGSEGEGAAGAVGTGGEGTGAARDPDGGREMIVLFSQEAAYRSFVDPGDLASPDGFTTNGISALYRGDMEDEDLRVLFAHEAVHLLDWRVIRDKAAPWLEEGLAQAMAVSRIEPSGTIHPEELGDQARVLSDTTGRDGRRETVFRFSAGYDAIRSVADGLRRGDLPTLEALVASNRAALTDPGVRHLRYFQCALFVRYLVEAEDGRWRNGFRAYLAGLARLAQGGGSPTETLPAALGTDWESLEQGFAKWVRSRDLRLVGPRRSRHRLGASGAVARALGVEPTDRAADVVAPSSGG